MKSNLPKIVADPRVPPGEAWLVQPMMKLRVETRGDVVTIVHRARILGKIVGLGGVPARTLGITEER